MGYPTKIATCCYCGTRAALVLDRSRHELTCGQCGAPLHDLKMLRTDHHAPASAPVRPGAAVAQKVARPQKTRKPTRKKPFCLKKLVEEVFDLVEDIFD